jgi:hypothetical protein
MEEDQGFAAMVDAASSPAAPAPLQLGQGSEKEFTTDKQPDQQENLVVEQTGTQQDDQQHVTVPPALTVMTGSNINWLPTNQKDIDQREAISKFLADGLRQLIVNQSNDGFSKIMGSLDTPSSFIHIDLAALGITSLSIAVNIPDQCDASLVTPTMSTQLMLQNSDDAQIHPNLPAPTTDSLDKGAQITKVYYRRRSKNKSGTYDKQTVEMTNPEITTNSFANIQDEFEKTTIDVEPSSQHEENISPASSEEYVPAHSTDIASMDKGKNNVARRRKCCTPISTQMLRRSPRFIEKLNGCKPVEKATNRNKTKGKKIKPQTDLLDDILLPSTCQTNEFPGLSIIDKYNSIGATQQQQQQQQQCNSIGATFPEIPIAEIQRVATEICRIAPSEVTTELLLTSRPEEAGPSRSAEIQ